MQSVTKGAHGPPNSFRSDIEGMRGVAVLLVVLFHCGVPACRGGFVGVDVFFALSGYLITGLIVNEVERSGKLSFRNFYARRVRRLLPASGLVVVSTLLLGWFVYSPLELARYVKWAVYTSLYISNYMFMRDAANYFASDVALNPYLHTWSLAVEEQFYLFWPAMIIASLALLKSRRGLAMVLLAVCIVSFGLCILLTQVRQPWAFFSLPTRAWEFALGGLACLLSKPQLVARTGLIKILGWAGLAGVVASGCLYSAQMNFPGYAAMLPIAGTVAVLIPGASGTPSLLQTVLGHGVLQYLGKLSYSWYLWHWPMILMAEACFPDLTWRGRLFPAAIALGLAQITFWILEKPVRVSPFLVARPALSLSIAILVAAVGLSAAKLVGRRVDLALRSPVQANLWAAAHDSRTLFNAHCLAPAGVSRIKECEYGDRGSSRTVILFGDSHAEHWFPALDAIAKDKHWRLLTLLKASCPVARVEVYNVVLKREDTECYQWREAALAKIVQQTPYLIILSEKNAVVVNQSLLMKGNVSHKIAPNKWEEGLHSTVSYLDSYGVKTLVIADVPRAPLDIPTCLSRAAAHSWGARNCVIRRDLALNLDAVQAENSAVKGIPGAKLVDFADKFCSGAICETTVRGEIVYRDSNHMTSTFAKGFAPLLEQQIDSLMETKIRN
jgi:peptidoglycan/LPS O-acetylase OafA/YrhL